MKYLAIIFCAVLFSSCGECDNSGYYQVKHKVQDGDSGSMCRYEIDGIGACASWQKTEVIFFTDSCSKFILSQIIPRSVALKYKK
jgi:hypothetical protein